MNGPASLVELDDLVAEGWPRPRGSPIRSIWSGLWRKSIQQRLGVQYGAVVTMLLPSTSLILVVVRAVPRGSCIVGADHL